MPNPARVFTAWNSDLRRGDTSPACVARVARTFADRGSGVRGDLDAVVTAVLLDGEARSADRLTRPGFGRLREPAPRLVHRARVFRATSLSGDWALGNLGDPSTRLGQSPRRPPSVFSLFRPGYVPAGTPIANAGLVALEFQLANETGIAGCLNFVLAMTAGRHADLRHGYGSELALAGDPAALVAHIERLLCADELPATAPRTVVDAAASIPATAADELASVTRRSIDAEAQVSAAIAGAPALRTPIETDTLAQQLKMVQRLICARAGLGVKRRVFMVPLRGFDLHDFLPDNHPGLLQQPGSAQRAFHDATVELGVADRVTTFIASDFARALSSNGDGSDQGWGSHHFVPGGPVKSLAFCGQAPAVAVDGADDVGHGRLLPTTSVDAFAETPARWFGAGASEPATVVPNLGADDRRDLGLL